jgi:hypothetical protein
VDIRLPEHAGRKVRRVAAAVAAAAGTLVAAPSALSAPGSQLWASHYDGPVAGDDFPTLSFPAQVLAVAGGRALVTGTSDGGATREDFATVAYDVASGAQLWAARYDDGGTRDAAAAIAASADGTRAFVTGSAATGNHSVTVAYDTATGSQLWRMRLAGSGVCVAGAHAECRTASAVAVSADGTRVFVTGVRRAPGAPLSDPVHGFVVAYEAATGRQEWLVDAATGMPDNPLDVGVAPDGSRVFVTGARGGGQARDYATAAFDSATGAEQWAAGFDGPPGSRPSDDVAGALAVARDGSHVFVTGTSSPSDSPGFTTTIAYDAATGAVRWQRSSSVGGGWSAALGDGALYVAGVAGVVAYGAADGAELWSAGAPAAGARLFTVAAGRDGRVYATGGTADDRDWVTVAYARDGTQAWTMTYAGAADGIDLPAAIAAAGSRVVVAGSSVESAGGRDYTTVAYDDAAPFDVREARVCNVGLSDCHPLGPSTPATFCCVGHFGTHMRIDVRGSGLTGAVLRLDGVPWASARGFPPWFGPELRGWRRFLLEEIVGGVKPQRRLRAGVYAVDVVAPSTGATAALGSVTVENPAPELDAVRVTGTAGRPPRAGDPLGLHVSGQVEGVNFTIPAGIVYWDGAPLATVEHDTSLVAVVPADLATAGEHVVQVVTPAPGGGASATRTVLVRP